MLVIRVKGTRQVGRALEREKESLMTKIADDTKSIAVSKTPIDQG